MKYYAKLDATNHVNTIYLKSQLTDTIGYTAIEVPDVWLDLFIQDWTNFYVKSDGSLDFDNNKASQTQQQINTLTASLKQAQATINQLLIVSASKGVK